MIGDSQIFCKFLDDFLRIRQKSDETKVGVRVLFRVLFLSDLILVFFSLLFLQGAVQTSCLTDS